MRLLEPFDMRLEWAQLYEVSLHCQGNYAMVILCRIAG
jgi:hypothetical protein